MAKTKPIGVRFDAELFEELKSFQFVKTYQETLNFLEAHYKRMRDEAINIPAEREEKRGVAHKAKPKADPIPSKEKEVLEAEIQAILNEKIPKERDTPRGKKAWDYDQRKRIEAIREQIKKLT
jgi:hypothetical protein